MKTETRTRPAPLLPWAPALALALAGVTGLAAQPSLEPAPAVELQGAYTVGADLAVTFDWSAAEAPPPASAVLKLYDSQGTLTSVTPLVPVTGSQTVWISGGAAPLTSDGASPGGGGTLVRLVRLVTPSQREIVLESPLAIDPHGPVIMGLPPSWPVGGLATGKQCYLHLVSLDLQDPEDKNGDEPYLAIAGFGIWRGGKDIKGPKEMALNLGYLTCDTCLSFQKDTRLDLFDQDDDYFPLFDPDDHLGSQAVAGCTAIPLWNVKMAGSNYTYFLKYRVACFEGDC